MALVGGKFLDASDFIQEAGSGTINGSNTAFTLSNAPQASTLLVYKNGLFQRPTTDYSVSGVTVTFAVAPATGSDLHFVYWRK